MIDEAVQIELEPRALDAAAGAVTPTNGRFQQAAATLPNKAAQ
jgi:hypothetical protein